MSVKFPMKGSEMRSLYSLAWFGKSAPSAGGADPVFSGYQAVEPAVESDGDVAPEESEVLAADLSVRVEGDPTPEEVEWMRNRKRLQAERVMHLFTLGYSGL